jgi:isopenicillin N synthase-like dioxygenase
VIAGTPLRGCNQWPQSLPEIRAPMMAYFRELGAMCDRILPVFAVALGMPAGHFAPYFAANGTGEGHANLRFLHYPPQEPDEDNLFGQAPHTDNSFMTASPAPTCRAWRCASRQMDQWAASGSRPR